MAQTAPHWAPKSIPTEMGWVDPKTGELLVAVKGLKIPKTKTTVVEEEVPPATE
jgi:hypothetical protein